MPPPLRKKLIRGTQATLRRFGVEVQPARPGYHYVPDYYGQSAAMRGDLRRIPQFGKVAAETIAEGRVCLYYDRLYVLYQVMRNLQRLIPKGECLTMVEIGVYRGGTSRFLAAMAQEMGIPARVHSFDTFEGHAAADIHSGIDTDHTAAKFSDTSFEGVSEYLSRWPSIQVHKGRFQDRCEVLEGSPVHLVHLDTDLYDPTVFGLDYFAPRFSPGSTVIVDDYDVKSCPGILQAVAEFMDGRTDFWSMHPLTEQCVLVKLAMGAGTDGA